MSPVTVPGVLIPVFAPLMMIGYPEGEEVTEMEPVFGRERGLAVTIAVVPSETDTCSDHE